MYFCILYFCYFLGCNLNYHKRCVVKLLNDCGIKNNQTNLIVSPRNPSNISLASAISDESVRIFYNFKIMIMIKYL